MYLTVSSLTNDFIILAASVSSIANDTPIPSFILLAAVMEMEQKGILSLDDKGEFIILEDTTEESEKIVLETIKANDISSLKGLIDYYLRQFTFGELDKVLESRYKALINIYDDVSFSKGNIIVNDNLSREKASILLSKLANNALDTNPIILFALLYGCRLLKKFLDKKDYRSMLAYIKEVPEIEGLPISQYIISNIDLIRGHIIGLVAN